MQVNKGVRPNYLHIMRGLVGLIRELGWINAVFYSVHYGLQKISDRARLVRYYLVAQPVPEKRILPEHVGNKIEVGEISGSEKENIFFLRPSKVIEDRYCQGARCLAGFRKGQFVGWLWFIRGQYMEDEVRCRFVLGDSSVWDFDVYVDPSSRLSPVFARLWDEAYEILRKDGVRWSFSRISAFNAPSLASHKRMGARRVGSAIFLCLGNIQIGFFSQSPYFHISRSSERIPSITLVVPDS
jgi:hypothetical protein